MIGRIVSIVDNKGFFFIRVSQDGKQDRDYFAHRSALRGLAFDELQMNQLVEFVEDPEAQRGPRAEEVRRPVESDDW